jgi:NADH-quinone oxidoreductase subunit H
MAWLRWLAPVLLALGVAWLAVGGRGCGREASPQLVQVLDVSPREVEAGERIALVGEGFPPARPARVTFRGTLRRPGQRPERGVEIVAMATVSSPEQLQLPMTEATRALFCGAGDRAVHTTFEGEIEVAFAAAVAGAPPIAGVLAHVVLDVRAGSAAADAERDREGARLLAWLGLKVAPGPNGLAVESVALRSRADLAGLAQGDVVTSFDGLRVTALGDVLPAPGAHEASVGVRRGGGTAEALKSVDVQGFRQAPPAELFAAALVVLAALAAVLLFAAPTRPALAARLQRVVTRLRAGALHPAAPGTSSLAGSARGAARATASFAAAVGEALPPPGPPALVDALVCALLAALPFGQYLVAAQLDVGLLFVAAATALVVVALVASGSPWRGARAAAHVAWQHVPAAAAVLAVVLSTGSLRVQEIERAQGGAPWDWLAFRSPAALVALTLLLACACIEPDAHVPPTALAAHVEEPGAPLHPPRGAWLAAACRAHHLVVAGLASTLFLGGWLLPGVSPAVQDARPALELAGAMLVLAKTWGLAVLLAWARRALGARTLRERSRRAAMVWTPLSLAVLAATLAWDGWAPSGAVQSLVSGALVALVGLAALAMAHRVRHGLLAPGGEGRLSPFL